MEAQPIVQLALEHHGGDPYRARHHRRLLLDAGFVHAVAGPSLGTGGVFGTEGTRSSLRGGFADQLRTPAFAELVLEHGWLDAPTFDRVIEEVPAWGRRPDAFWAVMGVTALGWVEAASSA
jgi:hypothetical protein